MRLRPVDLLELDGFQRASCLSIDWDSGLDLAMCVCHIHVVCSKRMYF